MKYELVVKKGPQTLMRIDGPELDVRTMKLSDGYKVLEVEKFLERLLGVRVHINVKS